jgi:hypothetical protein
MERARGGPLLTAPAPQRVLAIADDPTTLKRLADAIASGGASPVLVRGVNMLDRAPGPLPFRLVVYAWDGSTNGQRSVTSKMRDSSQLVAVTPQLPLASLTQLLAEPRCNHVLANDDTGMAMIQTTVQKFVTGDLFGIEKYLPKDTQVSLTRLREYKGRTAAIDEVLAFAEKVGVRRQVRSSIGQVCEELLMNALYDAPVDEHGNPLFAEVDLKERLDRLSPRPVSIRYAATETGFAVSVRDRFGRLDKATVLRYIDKCLHSPQQIDRKVYGAGLGIYLIVNACTQFVLNVAPGMATEVVCTFDRKSARSSLRALSVFVYPGLASQMTPALGTRALTDDAGGGARGGGG